jgi:hypothetical protein
MNNKMSQEEQISLSGYELEIIIRANIKNQFVISVMLKSSNGEYWQFMYRHTVKEILNDALNLIRDNQVSGKHIKKTV